MSLYSTPVAAVLAAMAPLTAEERRALLDDPALVSLPEVFAQVPDPRARRGRRYALPFLLTCLTAALLCQCDSTEAVGQWCREHDPLLARVFGTERLLTPTGSLYRRLLPRLSIGHLEWALAAWVRATRSPKDSEPLAFDGKTLRGAGTRSQPAPQVLAFCTHETQEALLQVRVADKTNEIPVAQAALPLLRLGDRVCTADALHTQTALVRTVLARHGHVVLTVKANQPALQADLALYFADPAATSRQACTIEHSHGRREARTITVTTALTAYLAPCWPRIAQVAQLTRTVTAKGRTRTELVYLITTLGPDHAGPERLLELVRGHWSIENGRHYVRDVTFGEDRSRLCTGHAPQVLAALRNLVITLIHRQGTHQIAATRRHFAAQPCAALAPLLAQPAS